MFLLPATMCHRQLYLTAKRNIHKGNVLFVEDVVLDVTQDIVVQIVLDFQHYASHHVSSNTTLLIINNCKYIYIYGFIFVIINVNANKATN